MSYQVKGISNLKYTRDIPDQNSGMGGYGFIPAPRKMSIRWTGNTPPFHKSRVFLSGMGFGYELGCTTLLTTCDGVDTGGDAAGEGAEAATTLIGE